LKRLELVVFLVLTAAAAAPFLFLENPPLQDYANSLARAVIVMEYDDETMPYREDFSVVYGAIPDIATDVFVPALAPLVGVEMAGRLFVALSVVLLPLGAWALFAAFAPGGRLAWLAFWTLPLAHNWYVGMGFLNYVLGLGLSLLLLALWVRWSPRWTRARLAVYGLAVLVLYHVHLFPLGALGLATLVLTLVERKPWRQRALDLAPFAPAVILFLAFRASEGLLPDIGVSYERYREKARVFFNLVTTYSFPEGLAITLALVLGWTALRLRQGWRPERRAFALALVFAATYVALPKMLIGVFYTDERILLYLALAVLLAWPLPESRRRLAIALACGIAVVGLGLSTRNLVALDREIGREGEVIAGMEPGKRVLSIDHRPFVGRIDVWHHVVCWYTIRKGGTTAYQFATPGKHVLRWRRKLAAPHEYFMRQLEHPPLDLDGMARDFDYIWKIDDGAPSDEELRGFADPVATRGGTTVWKVRKP
jgi:hypothetical protein